MDDYDEAVLLTYALLESRLARLEYLLTGPSDHEPKPRTVPDRILAIEHSLTRLAAKTALLDNVKELLTKHKDVLLPTPPTDTTTTTTDPPLTTPQKAHLIVDRAPSISTVASQLTSLSDSPMPTTDAFARLAALRPRIADAEQRHLQHALKIAELRRRSGLLVQRDRQVLHVAGGQAWAQQQERLLRAHWTLQREEARREEEEVRS